MTEPVSQVEYKTLDDIRLRKAQLRTELTKDNHKIQGMWNGLFHTPKSEVRPTSRMSSIMKGSVGVLDAAILGWKLYRKFGGKKASKRSRFSLFKK